MSQDTTQLENALLSVGDDIFDSLFIPQDEGLRREVIQMILRSGRMIEHLGHKNDLITVALDGALDVKVDPFAMMRTKTVLPMGLNPTDRGVIAAATPDMDLQFIEAGSAPHARAAAMRTVQYSRAFSLVSHHLGPVLDIGGNYAKHARSAMDRKFEIHSCTLAPEYDTDLPTVPDPDCVSVGPSVDTDLDWVRVGEGELEHHRQTQRDVSLALSGHTDVNRCVGGAENCTVQARHGVCVQALYDIDPHLWVRIFRQHGLEYVPCFFHYDVDMETEDVGYMPGPGMHWARTGENEIQAHFENDASHPYVHRRDWWLKYGSTWTMTEPDWEYVLYYEVEYMRQGDAKSSFVRLRKDTLGYAETIPQFRYIDVEEYVDVQVPKFNPMKGKHISDPLAYDTVVVRTAMALFSHVLRFGIANDTERPDLPLTFDRVKDQCHTFNHVRRVSGTSITVPYRLGTEAINDVSMGMYLIIVKRAAMNQAKYSAYTENMKRAQRRWGEENALKLSAKAVAYVTLAPFIMLAESFSEVVDVVTVSMRNQVVDNLVVMHGADVTPYRIMTPIRTVAGLRTADVETGDHGLQPPDDNLPDEVEPQQFYDVFKETMSPEHRKRVEDYLQALPKTEKSEEQKPESESNTVPVVGDSGDADVDLAIEPLVVDIESTDRDNWLAEYDSLQDDIDGKVLPPRNPGAHTFEERTNDALVWTFAREAVREYQLYNLDVALHVLEDAKLLCHKTWGMGKPRAGEVRDLNIQLDAGIHYFRVVDSEIMDMPSDSRYAYVIDPWTGVHKQTVVKAGKCRVYGIKSDTVFVCESLRIFNMFAIASRARKILMSDWVIRIAAVLIDGVPGCGKTYAILLDFILRDVIVTMVRETRDATFEDLLQDERFKDCREMLKARVRTGDSANMHGLPHARRLHIDEGLMGHAGMIAMSVRDSKPKDVYVYGDSTQIGFIDRGSKIGNLHFQSLFYWTQIVEMNETIRCPADAIWVSSQFYPEERRARIKTFSPVLRSITYQYEPDAKSPVWTTVSKPWIGVSILRGDRDDICGRDPNMFAYGPTYQKDDPRVPVYSVHEVQGRTKPFVVAMRLSAFNPEVVNSKPHANVMFTRHTMRMIYRSVVGPETDMNSRLAKAAMEMPEEELRKMMLPTPDWLQKRVFAREQKYAKYL